MEARSIKDNINIVRHLNARRLFNLSKVYTSYKLSSWLKRPLIWGKPFSLDFEPTTSCNLRCPECPSGLRNFTRPKGALEKSLFEQTIDEVHSHVFYLMFYFQGEPFLNPEFLNLVNYAKQKNIYVATSTNAHYLSPVMAENVIESGLNRLIISIDGTSQDSYEQYRIGGDLEKVLEGTKHIVDAKKRNGKGPHIIWQFIVFRHNEHQIEEVKALGKKMGVDEVRIKSAQLYDPEEKVNWMPWNEKYSRYAQSNQKLPNQCWRIWHASVLTWDGKVLPCCYDKDAQHQLGALNESQFDEVWNSSKSKSFKASILKDRSQHEICRNCGEGIKVWR